MHANKSERIVERIQWEEGEKNINNNSFVYCGIEKSVLWANHGKNWIDKAARHSNEKKNEYYTSCKKKIYYETKIIIFVAEFAVLRHFKRCRSSLLLPEPLESADVYYKEPQYIDLTTVFFFHHSKKKKFSSGKRKKKMT